jgi:non-ribosomal peptide synthetase-like protein
MEPVPAGARLLHTYFERSARAHPDRVALEVPPAAGRARHTLSYAELERRAQELALAIAPFVAQESVVAILLPRHRAELFVAELAVLKSGAAYTCLDLAYPDAHAAYLIEDSRAVVLVTDAEGAARARAAKFPVGQVIDVDQDLGGDAPDRGAHAETTARALPPFDPSSLAYVVYTSGTTGRPKGVMIEHRSIANLVESDLETFHLEPRDRVAQGSSHAYDSAVEETWLAFAAGATLVVLDDDAVRSGPDLVPWLRNERISVFCPPPTLLRATGCREPERELPDLRLLYVGGEALPRDLADRWSRGRWMENGYGPTECTVTVVRGRIQPGEPITIGRAVRGNEAWVLDADLAEVGAGESGELCLSGAGLGRGYLHREELTAEKFPRHPRFGRIYRTGDLVRREPDGQLSYLGRIDAQVKLRGHRIELAAVEALLSTLPGVRAAACRLQDAETSPLLVAFVVPAVPGEPPRFEALSQALQSLLPAYMVPSRFAHIAELPTSVGGKLDRSALPAIGAPERASATTGPSARDDLELRIARVFASALGLAAEPSIEDDFFLDLGGDSLAAAVAVSLLRDDPRTASLTVRDLYGAHSVGALALRARAARVERDAEDSAPREPRPGGIEPVTHAQAVCANAVQALFLLGELLVASALLYASAFDLLPRAVNALGLPLFLCSAAFLSLASLIFYVPFAVLFLVLSKRVLIGTYRPMRVPVYSSFYVRNWMVQQIARIVPWTLIAGTEFQNATLRALGAKIGRHVHLHRGVALTSGGFDLLTIEDDVMVGQDAALRLVDLERGALVVGPISLGRASTVDVRAGLSAHSSLGAEACLTALSSLAAGQHVPAGECWDGIPAAPAGRAPAPEPAARGRTLSPTTHAALVVCARALAIVLFALPFFALLAALASWKGIGATQLGAVLTESGGSFIGLVAVAVLVSVPLTLVLQGIALRALGRVPAGNTSRWSAGYVRILIKAEVVHAAGDWLSGTLFWPLWLRLAGMRIGENCEISTILDVVPECVEIGDECFLADGVYLGGPRLHRGVVTVARTRLARGSFLGNHVVIHAGDALPEDVLVGVCTVPNPASIHAHSTTFGHPPFELARAAATKFDRSATHEPSFVRRVNRILWESARCLLPLPPLGLVFVAAVWIEALHRDSSSAFAVILDIAAMTAFVAAASVSLVLVLKWLLLGRVRPGEHPLWSCWCSRWDFHYVAWAFWARGVLSNLEGTLFLAWYLRAMGARIGRRVVLSGGFAHVVDPDMLEFEDGVTVHALFQAHSFEDRVLKIDRVTLRAHADVGSGAVLFYGAEIGAGAHVAPHSVVMKHERLLPHRSYAGCPIRMVRDTGFTSSP